MKNIYRKLLILISLVALLTSCEKPKVIEDSELLNNLYSSSVDTLTYHSNKYILEACLYRDFFPGGPIPTKRPLIALISLVNVDSIKISTDLDITKLYVINGSLIWVSSPINSDDVNVPDYKLNKKNTDGPEWETDILVDVVIEITIKTTNDKYLIIKRDQIIERVE